MILKLPDPDPVAQSHSEQLQRVIQNEIEDHGSLSFARYMHLCLYTPGLGYYQAGLQKLGKGGDFITAPEISPLFGACLAEQIREILEHLGQGDILEFGAGTGRLAVDILKTLEKSATLPKNYYILELSAELQQRQKNQIAQLIPHLAEKVIWLSCIPDSFTGVVLANEVLDAMPVNKFTYQKNKLHEIHIESKKGSRHQAAGQRHFGDTTKKPSAELSQQMEQLTIRFAPNYTSEINCILPAWLASLGNSLTQGVILLIDYGFPQHEYYHPQRKEGTLMCHYQHRAHNDYFWWPGLQDITAHVDFTAVAKSAYAANLTVAGYTNQAYFLCSCGLESIAGTITEGLRGYQLSQEIKKLILPTEMGELFKVIALTKLFSQPLLGFKMHDLRAKL